MGFVFNHFDWGNVEVEEQAAARYFEQDLGFRVIRIDPAAWIEPTDFLRQQKQNGCLTMLAIPGNFREGFHHTELLEETRKIIGEDTPIYVFDVGYHGDEVDLGNNIFGVNPTSPAFLDKLNRLRGDVQTSYWKRRNLALQTEVLLAAYRQNFPDSPVDDNDAIILAFLRWDGMYPAEARIEEFNAAIPEQKPLETVSDDQFAQDLEAIRNIDEMGRLKLTTDLVRDSHARGFAIDSVTLAYETTARYASHQQAVTQLIGELNILDSIKGARDKATYKERYYGRLHCHTD